MITKEQFADEFSELAFEAGITDTCAVELSPRMSRVHRRDRRRYAEVDVWKLHFHFAPEVLDLPPAHRRGLIMHELGHVLCRDLPNGGTERDADRAAERVFGERIEYDLAWPGKGLQRAGRLENPKLRKRDDGTWAVEFSPSELALEELLRGPEQSLTIPSRHGWTLLVHPDTYPGRVGKWRLTRLDEDGPFGHTDAETWADAVREARYYGADYTLVTRENPPDDLRDIVADEKKRRRERQRAEASQRVYAVVLWRQDGRYQLDDAVRTYKTESGAQRAADRLDGNYVVRTFDRETGQQMFGNPPYQGMPARWYEKPLPKDLHRTSYRTKTDMLNVFLDANRGLVDDYGGEDMKHSRASFDAINNFFDIDERREVDTIVKAVWWAAPKGPPPFYLEDIDVELLNRTAPAIYNPRGLIWRLPDSVEEERLLAQEAEHWEARQWPDEDVPF